MVEMMVKEDENQGGLRGRAAGFIPERSAHRRSWEGDIPALSFYKKVRYCHRTPSAGGSMLAPPDLAPPLLSQAAHRTE